MPRSNDSPRCPSSVQPGCTCYGTEGNTPTARGGDNTDKIDEPLHKLCASALIFRTIIEIDHQRCDRGEPLADGLPPLGEAIHQAVTGDFEVTAYTNSSSNVGRKMPTGSLSPPGQSRGR